MKKPEILRDVNTVGEGALEMREMRGDLQTKAYDDMNPYEKMLFAIVFRALQDYNNLPHDSQDWITANAFLMSNPYLSDECMESIRRLNEQD